MLFLTCVARMQASRRRHDDGRIGARACACARTICSPRLGAAWVPSVGAAGVSWSGTLRAFPAGLPACRPSRLSLLSGVARSASGPKQ
jgi:hypothetical protein